jgi:hypothetical protein
VEKSYGLIACSVVLPAESMELADESVELAACADDFSRRSIELARCAGVFGRCSIVKTHPTVMRARSNTERWRPTDE